MRKHMRLKCYIATEALYSKVMETFIFRIGKRNSANVAQDGTDKALERKRRGTMKKRAAKKKEKFEEEEETNEEEEF